MKNSVKYILTHLRKADMISHIDSHPEDFEELIKFALLKDNEYSWRASWLLWSCMEKNDSRIQILIDDIIGLISYTSDSHQRELLKILQNMELNKEYLGILFDKCVSIWETINKQPSVRYIAFMIIVKITKKFPKLMEEIEYLTQNHYLESLSPAVRKGVNKMISGLKKRQSAKRQRYIKLSNIV